MNEPTLRQQLLDARAKVQRQIDRLRARPYPIAPIGFVRGGWPPLLLWLVFGILPWCVAPFMANSVLIDNSELIERLTKGLDDIDDALEEPDPRD
jgi:hypothetical protein